MNKRILGTLLSAIFIALLGIGIIAPIMPVYATDLGATGITLGLMVAGFSISRGVLQPFVGGLSDRKGKKRFLVSGLLVYAVAGVTYTFATSIEHLIFIRIFHGVGSAMIVPIAMSYIGELSPEGKEGKYMGLFNIALFSGIGGGPLVGGVFKDALGIDSAFYAMTAMSALSMALVLLLLPRDQSDPNREMAPPLLQVFRQMLGNSRVMGILLSRMSTMVIMVPTMAFLPILMTRFMDATGTEIGLVVSSRTLVNAAMQTPFGRMADRYNKLPILVVGSFIIAAAMFLVPFTSSLYQLIILFMIMGTGEAMVWPTLGALATEEGRQYGQGSMMGVFNMAMSAGIFIGSMGTGTLVDTLGLTYAFTVIAGVLVVATVVSAMMIRRPVAIREAVGAR